MIPRSERDVIVEHVLSDEGNLEVALKVAAARTELGHRVIVRFLAALRERLAVTLGEYWNVTACLDIHQYGQPWLAFLQADYRGHPGGFNFILGGDHDPKEMYVGVRGEASELRETLKRCIDEQYAAGEKLHEPWFWWRWIDDAYSYWGRDDSTLMLYRQREALDYYLRHLEQLARVIESGLQPAKQTTLSSSAPGPS